MSRQRTSGCRALLCGASLFVSSVASADVFGPPGLHMGPDSSHQALGPSLFLGAGKEGIGLGLGLRYQSGELMEKPYFRAALMAAPLESRYGAELGASFHLGSRTTSPAWWRRRVTADVLLTLDGGRLVPAFAPGVSVASLAAESFGEWSDLGVGLRVVLPPWHWQSTGPRLELSVTYLVGLHPWPRYRPEKDSR